MRHLRPTAGFRMCSLPRATRVKVLHTLTPLIVTVAGADEFGPHKD
jgi:hypothetical protein